MRAIQAAASAALGFWLLLFSLDADRTTATTTRLQFYMHDNFNMSPQTAVRVAESSISTTAFGRVIVIDDPLTELPSLDSQIIGRAQGTYIFSALDGSSLLLTFSAVFSGDSSSLSFHGADSFLLPQREIAVIGGTGKFRSARGFATINTTSNTNTATIMGFDVTVEN